MESQSTAETTFPDVTAKFAQWPRLLIWEQGILSGSFKMDIYYFTTNTLVFRRKIGSQGREKCGYYTNIVVTFLSVKYQPASHQYTLLFQRTRRMCHLRMLTALVASSRPSDYKPALPICPGLCQLTEKGEFSCSARQGQLTDLDWRGVSGLEQASTLTNWGKVENSII